MVYIKTLYHTLVVLEPQSRFGDKPVKFQVVRPQNGTVVLKGLIRTLGSMVYIKNLRTW